MSTNNLNADQIVTVCFNPGDDADWFAASEKVNDLMSASGTPARRFRVRHRRFIGWLTRFFGYYLLDAVRKFGSITIAAGGRKSRLDLPGMSQVAANEAIARWRAWNTHIKATTPNARTWEDFLAQHKAAPAKVTLAEARRRFEEQPRVTAMLEYGIGQVFDPYELSAYQAGEATYAGLHWRVALIGDALITTDGRILRAASGSLADRLRFLNEACMYLRTLSNRARLCAVTIA